MNPSYKTLVVIAMMFSVLGLLAATWGAVELGRSENAVPLFMSGPILLMGVLLLVIANRKKDAS